MGARSQLRRQAIGKIAMGIDQAKAKAARCILQGEVGEKRRLARPCLTHNMQMHQPISKAYAKGKVAVPALRKAQRAHNLQEVFHAEIVGLEPSDR